MDEPKRIDLSGLLVPPIETWDAGDFPGLSRQQPVTLSGFWPKPDPLETFERHAQTGEPMPLTIDCGEGNKYAIVGTVRKDGDGKFTVSPLEPARRVDEGER